MQDLKIELISKADGRKVIKRTYEEEATAYRELRNHNCKNLPQIYYAEMCDGCFVAEEEFIDGISLQEMLDAGERLNEKRACEVASEVCIALDYLHQNGFVHRDVKPEHIFFTEDGGIFLIDLDASMKISPGKNRDTQLLGTTGYAAPEQFGLTRSDSRTDIFAVGILINEMLTGEHPSVTLYRKSPLGEIITKCIQMNPQDRYQSAKELSETLNAICESGCELQKQDQQNEEKQRKAKQNKDYGEKRKVFLATTLFLCLLTFAAASGGISDKSDTSHIVNDEAKSVIAETSSKLDTVKKDETDAELTSDKINNEKNENKAVKTQKSSSKTKQTKKSVDNVKQLYIHGNQTTYHNFRLGSQSASLKAEDGTRVDESFLVWTDKEVGTIEEWDDYYKGWRLVSENCDMGAVGYLYAEKDGQRYRIKVEVMGEPMSAFTALPDMDNLPKGYLKPGGMAIGQDVPNQIFLKYDPDKPLKIYLAAMYGFNDIVPACTNDCVSIKRYTGSANWNWPIYELVFENSKGGDVQAEVTSKHNDLVFCFEEA